GRTRVRMVDVTSEYYRIARGYMLRLTEEDFNDPHELAKFAATAGVSLEAFRNKFHYIIENDMLFLLGQQRTEPEARSNGVGPEDEKKEPRTNGKHKKGKAEDVA